MEDADKPLVIKIYDADAYWVGVRIIETLSKEEFRKRYPEIPEPNESDGCKFSSSVIRS
jgi:hypothetical protein